MMKACIFHTGFYLNILLSCFLCELEVGSWKGNNPFAFVSATSIGE